MNSLKLLKRKGTKTPEHVISLGKIEDLRKIVTVDSKLKVGAMVTISDLYDSPHLNGSLRVLRTVCKNISTTPIRNMATVGGNLTCRYTWTEMPAVMIGLGAQLHFAAADGTEESMAAEDFFKNAAKTEKILTSVSITNDPSASLAYRRVKKTPNVDIPMLSLLIKTDFNGKVFRNTRVSVNNCVTFAQRDLKLEEFLDNNPYSENIADEALNHLDHSIYDTRSNDYKKHMFRVSIKSAIQELTKRKA